MFKPLFGSAATAILCLLIPAVGASAQQAQAQTYNYSAYAPGYANPTMAAVIGTYRSQEFYPSPLTLTITGIDASGNLSGTMSGWRGTYEGGEAGEKWATWQRVFGNDATAVYRDGRINITFSNGASYVLEVRGNQLSGQFAAGNDRQPVSFLRSYSLATAR